jgi:hypothetical protein
VCLYLPRKIESQANCERGPSHDSLNPSTSRGEAASDPMVSVHSCLGLRLLPSLVFIDDLFDSAIIVTSNIIGVAFVSKAYRGCSRSPRSASKTRPSSAQVAELLCLGFIAIDLPWDDNIVATIELGAALIINALFRWIAPALIRSERWRQAVGRCIEFALAALHPTTRTANVAGHLRNVEFGGKSCPKKLLNTTRRHQNMPRMPPGTTEKRPSITRLEITRRRRTMLTQRMPTDITPEGMLKKQRKLTPRSMA